MLRSTLYCAYKCETLKMQLRSDMFIWIYYAKVPECKNQVHDLRKFFIMYLFDNTNKLCDLCASKSTGYIQALHHDLLLFTECLQALRTSRGVSSPRAVSAVHMYPWIWPAFKRMRKTVYEKLTWTLSHQVLIYKINFSNILLDLRS